MTKNQLQLYIAQNSNIDFDFNGKRYGIENVEDENGNAKIHFWEWNNAETFDNSFSDFSDFEQNAKIGVKKVADILLDIDDADIF